ncbi:MAG: hypothetical protein AAF554_02300 [Bacteroidota bacterium]
MIKYWLVGLMMTICCNTCFSQYTMDDIDSFVLEPVFETICDSVPLEMVEKDQNGKIHRRWLFDEKCLLVKEIDYRASSLSSAINGETFSITMSLNALDYTYNKDNKVEKVFSSIVQNGDTIKSVMNFDYSTLDVVKMSTDISRDTIIQKDIIKTTYLNNSKPDSIVSKTISSVKGFSSRLVDKSIFVYDKENKLQEESSYYEDHMFWDNGESTFTPYKIHYRVVYEYDELDRVQGVTTYHFDEQLNPQIHSKKRLHYEKSTSKIVGMDIPIYNKQVQQDISMEFTYDEKNRLTKVVTDYGITHYEYNYQIKTE